MLKVFHRIVGLEQLKEWARVSDKQLDELIRDVALSTPESVAEPIRILTSISNPLLPHIQPYYHMFRKTLGWVAILPIGITTAMVNHLLSNNRGDNTSVEHAQYAFRDKRAAIKSLFEMWESYRNLWIFNNSTSLAVGGVVIYGGLYYFFKDRLNLGASDEIDYNQVFKSLNEDIVKGTIKKGIERIREKTLLKTCWTKVAGQKFRIPFLTGPTGAGKTQFVENFAWSCVYDKTFPFYGKTVFWINTAKLLQEKSLLTEVFETIKGREDDFILFFDEAHNASNARTNLLELFKTEILNANVRCVMATTTDEYQKFIASNAAFVSRLRSIEIKPFDDQQTKNLLLEETLLLGHPADTHSHHKKFFNPRKSLHIWQEALSTVSSWAPLKLSEEIQTAENTLRALKVKFYQKDDADPNWSTSEEGQKTRGTLKTAETDLERLTEKLSQQTQLHEEVLHLQSLISQARSLKDRQVHRLSKDKLSEGEVEEAKKQYLWTKYVVVPELFKIIQAKQAEFKMKYEEEIPLKIDAAFIQAHFKEPTHSSNQ